MRLLRHPEYCPEAFKGSVLALGNFDGVHRGHREILEKTLSLSRDSGAPSAAMTFEPHPISVLRPGEPFRITPFHQKARLLQEAGLELLFALHFTRKFSQMTGVDFIRKVLVEQLAVRHIIIGEDFHFGHNRDGNADLLLAMAAEYGYALTRMEDIGQGERFSSTRIRQALREGDIEAANTMLGHAYTIEGRVRRGEGRGAKLLGCPTANIYLKDEIRPKPGVYISEARMGNPWLPAITHIGVNTTFGGKKAVVETHIFDFNGDLYGNKMVVRPLKFLRAEEAFATPEALKTAMDNDIRNAREYFGR